MRRFWKELLRADCVGSLVIFAERSSIRIVDALPSTSTGTQGEQEFKVIGRVDRHVGEANKDRACTCELARFPASWVRSMLVLAAPIVRGETAAAKAT